MAGLASAANLGGVADPRLGNEADAIGTSYEKRASISHNIAPADLQGINSIYNNRHIKFEDFHFWANRSREYEKTIRTDDKGFAQTLRLLRGGKLKNDVALTGENNKHHTVGSGSPDSQLVDAKNKEVSVGGSDDYQPKKDKYGIEESEWETAQRAVRTATWGSIFYLITTDILGPTNVPWAISQMGYGPGFALYFVFGIMACYSGFQLWQIFCGMDSTRYPLRNYGDLGMRVFGSWARIIINVLQSFQFFLNVTLIIESNGQGLAQMATGKSGNGFLCFVVAEVIFTILGFILGQIRTLQRLSYLANLAIWLNVFVVIMTMVVVHVYPPNYGASLATYGTPRGPVVTTANWPPGTTLIDRINGLMNCVFAYGGATLFTELMAEMRRPFDFWKGFLLAEIFIFVCYLLSGMVTYAAQGQFTYNPSYQGIPSSAYAWQTVGNAFSFITGLIAALLYGNIGIKVFYSAVLRDVFRFPPLDTKKGKWLWVALVPLYWALAFIIAAAIPQLSNLTSFVGAACILQFSYTFPPWLIVGYRIQRDAVQEGEEYDYKTGVTRRLDSGIKRWARGFRKNLALNTFDVLYGMAALATAGLGIYASVLGMHAAFTSPTSKITSFTCANPAGA